ncbi:unnamed protein product [Parnassius apollo]|uniref:(apollo) hypothetical protein n=1 Tax=Parnassius apollo TaxID=110799 RepID=A0A8S3W9S4_PARAO|nr:unnamed protein product [Parnassius apollo]
MIIETGASHTNKFGIAEVLAAKSGKAEVLAAKSGTAEVLAAKSGGVDMLMTKSSVADVLGLNLPLLGHTKSSKKVVSASSNQTHKIPTNCDEEEDIIEVEMVSDKGQEKEKQERVEEIYYATFKCREKDKGKNRQRNKDLLFDLNHFEEMCDNLEVLDETDVNVDNSKHKITNRKRNCIQEEKWEVKAQKIPKLNTEKENISPINQTKSQRNVVSRHSECHKYKIRTSLQL